MLTVSTVDHRLVKNLNNYKYHILILNSKLFLFIFVCLHTQVIGVINKKILQNKMVVIS